MPVAPEHAGGGPVYFAWVDPTETTFGPEHIRYDEYIFSFEIDLSEGKLPVATVDMKNPGALLSPARKRWAWIAFDDGTGVTPKFFGRINGVPSSIFDEVVTVNFEARPLDYLARKQATAETLKVPPYYDELFIDPQFLDDPDTILEGYPAAWHFDPVNHAVTISDYLVGEAGEQEFLASDIIDDSLTFELGDPPTRAVAMDASVTYTQAAVGTIDTGIKNFSSYTGQGLYQSWPKPGASIGAGWSVASASADDGGSSNASVQTFQFKFENKDKTHQNGDAMSVNESVTRLMGSAASVMTNYKSTVSQTVGDPETGRAAATSIQESGTYLLNWKIRTTLVLRYDAARARTEHLTFTLAADLQPMLTDVDGTNDIETLTLSGGDVGKVLPGSSEPPPIGDVARRSFFPTERGLQAAAYALNVARAHILSKCRVAATGFVAASFERALGVSCRHTVRAHANKLPGGAVVGKVVNVKLSGDGDSGVFAGLIGLKSAAGYGAAIEEVAGTPVYVDADVLGPETQVFAGRFIPLASGDLGFTPPTDGPADDGLVFPLTYDQVVVRDQTVTAPGLTQEQVIARSTGLGGGSLARAQATSAFGVAAQAEDAGQALQTALAAAGKWYELELKPLTGSFETSFDITAGPLSVPAQANLEAA